uniref:Uncharacterized protein n=1 Tax=Nelumbo nucifera TaxID=4432 RepID=A0A822XH27_NELNU|nr:TPA_asm: hypothetical protein HUJ06_020990 [Nelumbo nucifera]
MEFVHALEYAQLPFVKEQLDQRSRGFSRDTPKVEPPRPPTEGCFDVVIDNDSIQRLDISPVISSLSSDGVCAEPKELLEWKVGFTTNYTRDDPYDPRELSEFPDIRLICEA